MLSGRCSCDAVAYEVSDEFVVAYNCHCSNCRAMTGAAFLPVGQIERDKLTVTKGAESLLVEGDPDSTHEVRCGECFSLLYWTYGDGTVGVPYGTLIDEPTLKPMHHQFVGSKAPWYEILDDLPQHDRYPWSDRRPSGVIDDGVNSGDEVPRRDPRRRSRAERERGRRTRRRPPEGRA